MPAAIECDSRRTIASVLGPRAAGGSRGRPKAAQKRAPADVLGHTGITGHRTGADGGSRMRRWQMAEKPLVVAAR